MPATRFAIDAFKDVPGTVEIVALGRILRQPSMALEAQIEVILASRLDASDFEFKHDVHCRWVASGQLDLLTIGSRWKRGFRVDERHGERHAARYDCEKVEKLGVGAEHPVDARRRLPSRTVAGADCFLLERAGAAKGDGLGPRVVLLPQMELVRALFGVSGRMVIELIDGLRDPTVADRGLLDRKRSELLPDGTVRLDCWRRPTREEALILAAMVADPALMRLHDEVFQQLSVQKEYREDMPVWSKVTWPFPESVELDIEGRWFERQGGALRFLGTRITGVGLRLAFTRVEVICPGAGDEETPDRQPPASGRLRPANARVVVLTTGRSPSPSRRPIEIASEPVSIPASRDVSIDFVARTGPSRPAISSLGEDPREEGEFSTAGREGGADPAVGRAEIRRKVGGDAHAAASDRERSLRITWAAVVAAVNKAGWRLTPYPLYGGGGPGTRDGGFDFGHEGILAGVNVEGMLVVVADGGTIEGDRRSLGLLVPTTKRPVRRSDLAAIREAGAEYGGRWGSASLEVQGFGISAVRRHPAVIKDADLYAALLRRRIADAAVAVRRG